MFGTEQIHRLLAVIADDVVPLTRAGVAAGNKVFGAAIVRKDDLSTVVAATNNEIENPLWHGEISAIKAFYELADRPDAGECLLLATHEPCSLCLSGIVWGGFDEFAYLFSHRDSAESFAIPHDIAILKGVYAVADPDRDAPSPARDLYNRTNRFFSSTDLMPSARECAPAVVADLERVYAEMSTAYQARRGAGNIAWA